MEYYENIRRLRREKNWTQQQLAEKLQVSRQTVARWESGWNVPNLLSAQKMSELFGVSVGELMTGKNSQTGAPAERAEALPSLLWFSALCILFAVLFRLLGNFLSEFFAAICAVFLCAFLLLAVWWGIKLLEKFLKSDDPYSRKLFYGIWRWGNWIYGAAICAVLQGVEFGMSFSPGMEIFGMIFSGTFCFVFSDTLMKLLLRNKMVTEQNPLLPGDIAFLAVSGISLTTLAVLAGLQTRGAMIYFIVFWSLLGLLGCGYFLLRTAVSFLLFRRRLHRTNHN